jgi:hypothetical protein
MANSKRTLVTLYSTVSVGSLYLRNYDGGSAPGCTKQYPRMNRAELVG